MCVMGTDKFEGGSFHVRATLGRRCVPRFVPNLTKVEVDLDHGGLLLNGGSWTLAFGLKNASTVHYRGDAAWLRCLRTCVLFV